MSTKFVGRISGIVTYTDGSKDHIAAHLDERDNIIVNDVASSGSNRAILEVQDEQNWLEATLRLLSEELALNPGGFANDQKTVSDAVIHITGRIARNNGSWEDFAVQYDSRDGARVLSSGSVDIFSEFVEETIESWFGATMTDGEVTLDGVSSGSGVDWTTLRLTSPSSGTLLSEWWFAEGSGSSVADQVGSANIDLSTPTNPNATWTTRGISLASGLIQTPSITGVRTVAMLVKTKKDETTGFLLSGGSQSGAGVLGDSRTTAYSVHTASSRGVIPLLSRTDNGLGGYRLNRGGWYLLVCDFATAYNTILGFGGRHSTTTSRCTEYEVAWAACFSSTLTDAERSSIYTMARALAKSRSFYIDYRDCPSIVDTICLWGQSNAEGRALITDLSVGNQSRTTPDGVFISRRDTRVTAALEMGVNQTTANTATQFGPEMPIAWAYEDAGHGLYISKCGIGSTYLYNTAGSDWSADEVPTTGILSPTALRQLWTMEADMLNAGIGPRLKALCWMQGEQDATNATYGAAYETNMTNLIAKYREQVGDATAKVIIARIREEDPTFDAAAVADVRAAQESVADSDANVSWFDTDSFSLAVDQVHYDAAGMVALGQAFYAAIC